MLNDRNNGNRNRDCILFMIWEFKFSRGYLVGEILKYDSSRSLI